MCWQSEGDGNSNKPVKVLPKKSLPVIGGDNDCAICCSNKLSGVDFSRRVDDVDKVSQATHFGASISVCIVIEHCLIDVLLLT